MSKLILAAVAALSIFATSPVFAGPYEPGPATGHNGDFQLQGRE